MTDANGTPAVYDQGEAIRLDLTFEDDTGAPEDPDTITLTLQPRGGGTAATYTFATPGGDGPGSPIVKDGTGTYHAAVVPSGPGWWGVKVVDRRAGLPDRVKRDVFYVTPGEPA